MTQSNSTRTQAHFFANMLLVLLVGMGAASAQLTSQPVVILVRDGAGHPLAGIPLRILVTGPPHQPFDSGVTGDDGMCHLNLPPGAYLIQFERGWRGRAFIPVEEQNAGAMNDAGGVGGFGIVIEPSDEVQVVTFVVGQQDGRLVPLWDMSRNPEAPPQPFAIPANPLDPPGKALAGIDLSALDTAIPSQQGQNGIAQEGTATAQVVVSELLPGQGEPSEEEANPELRGDIPAPGSTGIAGGIWLAAIGLLPLALFFIVLAFVLRRKAAG